MAAKQIRVRPGRKPKRSLRVRQTPIRTRADEAHMEAALASEMARGPVARWARVFGLWTSQALLALAALLAPGHVAAQADAGALPVVRCLPHAAVSGGEIVLGDIALISAPDGATESALGQVALGPAPRLGQQRPLTRAHIAARLAQAGWDEDALRLESPDTLTVEREAREFSRAELETLVRELLPGALGCAAEDLIIEGMRLPQALAVPPAEVRWELRVAPGHRPSGPVAFELVATDGLAEVGRAQGMAQIDVAVPLVVTAVDVPRGALITPEMLQTRRGSLRQAPRGALLDPAQAAGLIAAQSLRAGAVLTDRSVAPPLLVRRGETVTVVFESEALRITDRAEAAQDGAAGDEIAVRNLQSGRTLRALVTGPRTVRVLP